MRGARVGARPFHHNRERRLAGGGCRRTGRRERVQASSLACGNANRSVGEVEELVAGQRSPRVEIGFLREAEFECAAE